MAAAAGKLPVAELECDGKAASVLPVPSQALADLASPQSALTGQVSFTSTIACVCGDAEAAITKTADEAGVSMSPLSSATFSMSTENATASRQQDTCLPTLSNPQLSLQPFLSQVSTARTFSSLPSLDVDYSELDGDDMDLVLGRLPTLLLYGPFGSARARDTSDARNRALRKLNAVIRQHGLSEMSFNDYLRALRIFSALVRRKAKLKARERAARLCERREATERKNMWAEEAECGSPQALFCRQSTSIREGGDAEPGLQGCSQPRVSLDRGSTSSLLPPLSEVNGLDSSRLLLHTRLRSLSSLASVPQVRHTQMRSDNNAPLHARRQSYEHPDCPPSPNPRNLPENNVSVEHVQLFHHLLRHAEAIYGLPLNVRSAPGTSIRSLTDRNIVIRRTGIDADGLLAAQFSSDAFRPAHYVAVDRRVRSIVVCVRGTANLLDCLSDLSATLEPFSVVAGEALSTTGVTRGEPARRADEFSDGNIEGFPAEEQLIRGHGHSGVLRSARQLFERIRPVVLQAVSDHPTYGILITGHSLGGAVGAVLALIMREDASFPGAHAVCIGPPPCLSENIAQDANDSVVCLVNGADIVPRLTVNALLPYFTTCRYVKSLNTTKRRLIDMGMQSIAVDWEHLISSSKKDLDVARNEMDASRLFVPGIVLQMVEPKDVQRQDAALLHLFSDVKVDVIRVPRTDFVRVRREKGMFMMHAPHRYRQSLMSALKELGGEPLRRKANSGGLLRSLMQLPTSRVMDSSTVAGDSDANPLRRTSGKT